MDLLRRFGLTPHHRELVADGAMGLALTAFEWVQISVPVRVMIRALPVSGLPERGRPFIDRFAELPPSPLAYVLLAATALPLVWRRRWPVATLWVIAVATALFQMMPSRPVMSTAGFLIALYTAGTMLERRRLAAVALPAALLVVVAAAPPLASPLFWADLIRDCAVMLMAAALGDATRNRRAYVAEMERRALDAERSREEEAARRVDEERLRIARELHDITAHSLSIVAVQSGAALHVLDSDPVAARSALTAIRETSRSALTELRAMLGVLRGEGEAPEAAPLAPAAGLARIEELLSPLRAAGLRVSASIETGEEPLPAIVDASAYRIIQEALTNVLRHAGPATVTVRVWRDGDDVALEVDDDGQGAPEGADAAGHGIAGMRERALALGGSFAAGPRGEGGWRVSATVPVTGRGTT